MTGGKLEGRDVALAARGVDSIAVHCERKAEPQWHLGASHVGAPDVINAQGRLDVGKLRRLVRILVLGTGSERE